MLREYFVQCNLVQTKACQLEVTQTLVTVQSRRNHIIFICVKLVTRIVDKINELFLDGASVSGQLGKTFFNASVCSLSIPAETLINRMWFPSRSTRRSSGKRTEWLMSDYRDLVRLLSDSFRPLRSVLMRAHIRHRLISILTQYHNEKFPHLLLRVRVRARALEEAKEWKQISPTIIDSF